jgi:hypothetical protein
VKIYKTSRYEDGQLIWRRFSANQGSWGAALGNVRSLNDSRERQGKKARDSLELEVVEVPDEAWELIKSSEKFRVIAI